MKIFYALEAFLPHISGVTVSTDRLADYFSQDKKNKVYVITASPKGDFQIDSDSHKYTVIRIKSYPNPIRRRLRISYLALPYIRKILDDFKPDIIHLQDPFFISQSLAFEAKKRKIPVIATQHSSLSFPLAYLKLPKFLQKTTVKTMEKALSAFLNNFCEVLITPSQFIKKEVIKWGISIPIEVISNGVDIKFFQNARVTEEFLEKYNLKDFLAKSIVLYAGRIDKDKNLEVLLKAIPLVLREIEANFIFLGQGELKEKLIKEIKETPFKENVRISGPLDFQSVELAQYYQIATLFAMPSSIEAQSISTMEAMASGLPIVASNGGALPELVKDGKNGYLVNFLKEEEFAAAIIKILKNNNLRKKIAEKSSELIKPHDINNTFRCYQEIYEKVCENFSKN